MLRSPIVLGYPAYLACDIASARQLQPRIAACQRAGWQVAAMKICLVHDKPLVVLANDLTPGPLHGWALHVGAAIPELPRFRAEAALRPLTGLETYVVARLSEASVRSVAIAASDCSARSPSRQDRQP